MKAIIFAAGPTDALSYVYGFPKGAKPKCLFHYKGEILLERQVRLLRKCGIKDIRVVVGYKKGFIERFNKRKKLGLKLIYNPEAATDNKRSGWKKAWTSWKVGLKGIADDVLLILGDVYFTKKCLLQVIRSKQKSVTTFNGVGIGNISKVAKQHVAELRNFKCRGLGRGIHDFILWKKGVKGFVPGKRKLRREHYMTFSSKDLRDIDYFRQTDEGKK
ncbi:hypothetical protein ES702_00381 [subsurface metagenome]